MIITTISSPKQLPGSTTHAWYRGKAGPEKKCMEDFEREYPWLKQDYTGFYCAANSTLYVPLQYLAVKP